MGNKTNASETARPQWGWFRSKVAAQLFTPLAQGEASEPRLLALSIADADVILAEIATENELTDARQEFEAFAAKRVRPASDLLRDLRAMDAAILSQWKTACREAVIGAGIGHLVTETRPANCTELFRCRTGTAKSTLLHSLQKRDLPPRPTLNYELLTDEELLTILTRAMPDGNVMSDVDFGALETRHFDRCAKLRADLEDVDSPDGEKFLGAAVLYALNAACIRGNVDITGRKTSDPKILAWCKALEIQPDEALQKHWFLPTDEPQFDRINDLTRVVRVSETGDIFVNEAHVSGAILNDNPGMRYQLVQESGDQRAINLFAEHGWTPKN